VRNRLRLRVADPSQVGEARRAVSALGSRVGFDEHRVGQLAVITTELGTNLVKHAGAGELLVRTVQAAETMGVEVLSLDRGPGIAYPAESLRDGHSTAGTPGNGLGAVRRLSSLFDIFSEAGTGTVVLSRLWNAAELPPMPPRPVMIGAISLPLPRGEELEDEECGDAWAAHQDGNRTLLMVADGLGHGAQAAHASAEAVRIFRDNTALQPAALLERMHPALHSTRGAAVAVVEAFSESRIVRYAGVGNIVGRVVTASGARNMVSYNGTVGVELRKVQEFTYPWPTDGLLILHSDGVATHWNLDEYAGLRMKHPSVIAGVLFRDHARARDDATVVVVRDAR